MTATGTCRDGSPGYQGPRTARQACPPRPACPARNPARPGLRTQALGADRGADRGEPPRHGRQGRSRRRALPPGRVIGPCGEVAGLVTAGEPDGDDHRGVQLWSETPGRLKGDTKGDTAQNRKIWARPPGTRAVTDASARPLPPAPHPPARRYKHAPPPRPEARCTPAAKTTR